jgi:hypothetical protein
LTFISSDRKRKSTFMLRFRLASFVVHPQRFFHFQASHCCKLKRKSMERRKQDCTKTCLKWKRKDQRKKRKSKDRRRRREDEDGVA